MSSLIYIDASLKAFELFNCYYALFTSFVVTKAYFVATSYPPLLLDESLPAGAPNVSEKLFRHTSFL